VAHVVGTLRQVVDEVVVVSSADLELPRLDARVIRDREPWQGPLAGVREGLAEIASDFAFVTGTDAPFITPAFVEALLGFQCAAAPEIDGYVQTLSTVYPRAALPQAEALLTAGRMRLMFLLEAVDYRKVDAEDLPDVASARGFNTPREYLDAVRDSVGEATATLEFLGRARLAMGRSDLEVPVGTLADVLGQAAPTLALLDDGRVARSFLVSLDGHSFVRDATIPVGPGERVIVLDASVGG